MKSLTLKIAALLLILAGLSVSCIEEIPDPTPIKEKRPTVKLELGLYNPRDTIYGLYPDRINFINEEEVEFISTMLPVILPHFKYVIKKDSIQLITMNGSPSATLYFKIIHSKKFLIHVPSPRLPDGYLLTYEKNNFE